MLKIKKYFRYILTIIVYIASGSFLIFWAYFTLFNGSGAIIHDSRLSLTGRDDIVQTETNSQKTSDKKIVNIYSTVDNELFSLTFPSQPVCTEKVDSLEGVELITNTCVLKEENDTRQYLINWVSYPDTIKTHSPNEVLEQTLNEKMRLGNLEILSQKFAEQEKYSVIEYTTKTINGINAEGEIIFSGNTIYDLVFIHYVDDKKTSNVFLQSFNLK